MKMEKINKLTIIILITLFIFIPSILEIIFKKLPGNDPFEYAIGSLKLLNNFSSIYAYPYPLMDIFYIPVNFFSSYQSYIYAILMNSISFSILFFSIYLYFSKKPFLESITLASLITFSPLFLSEFNWGGQAQILSISMVFFSLYFLERKNYIFLFFIALSIFLEPYSSLFGILYILFFNIYNKYYKFLLFYIIILIVSYSYYLIIKGSQLVIPTYINNPIFISIPPIWWLYIIFLILLYILFFKKDNIMKSIFSIISFSAYFFITPYYDYPRIFYFLIISLVFIIDIDYIEIQRFKKILIILILIFLIISYSNFSISLMNKTGFEKYYIVGNYIKENTLKNECFLNVNVQNGWSLEFFAEREMFYASSNLQFLIFKNQVYNSLIGKIISYSEIFYYNQSNGISNYLFINNISNFYIFRYDSKTNDFYQILSFNYETYHLKSNERYINFSTNSKYNYIEIMNYSKIQFMNKTVLIYDKYNKFFEFKIFENYTIDNNFILLSNKNNISIPLINNKIIYGDDLCKEYNIKYIVVENKNLFYYRFFYDNNFTLEYSFDNIYIFEFKNI